MKNLKNNIPVMLLILFEITVGILLLVNPEAFTAAVITCFGIVLLAIGIVYLIRFIREKKESDKASILTLVLAVISLAVGCVCAFLTNRVMGLFAVVAVVYGVILIVSGIYKAKTYFDMKQENLPVSVITLVSAILSIVLGIVIVVNPFTATNFLWFFAGISLIVEAVVDFVAVIMNVKPKKQAD